MTGIADKIMKRVSVHDRGRWVWTPKDFLDLGSRGAVDQALSRLSKAGRLRRVGHGLYDMPRISSVLNGPAPVDLDAAVAALARRDGARIMPDGLLAANQLGLTNAVPAKVSYVTDGHSRTLKIDGRTVRLRHAGPTVMQWAGRPAEPVVQVLRWLGRRAAADAEIVSRLNRHLPDNVKFDLLHNSRNLPGWALPLARSIVSDQGRCRMTEGFDSLLALPEQDRRDVFEAAASRLDTLPGYVEKDFWVCLVLNTLFNRRPEGHPRLLFKGGTSLSNVFGVINRFSEDIDLVVSCDGLGFEGERDPTVASQLSNKKRAALPCGRLFSIRLVRASFMHAV